MKSNIKYVSNDTYRKELLKLVYEKTKRVNGFGLLYEFLLYVKYIIEKERMNYYEIIDGNIDELIKILRSNLKGTIYTSCIRIFIQYKLYELMGNLAFKDYIIESYNDRVLDSYIKENKKYLIISNNDKPYIKNNVDVLVKTSVKVQRYALLDEITNNKRNVFTEIDDINKYDSIIYICDNNYVEYDYKLKKEMLFIYDYSYASNLLNIPNMINIHNMKYEIYKVNSILLDDDRVYIKYGNTKEEKISIKELSNVSNDKLDNIINSNKEIENISKNITIEELKNNHYRIGIKGINNEKDEKILRLVEHNKYISHRINKLDSIIYSRIDRLLNR